MDRTIINPVVKDKVTFIKMAHETNGELTWIRVHLAPNGGNDLHFHDKFTETFIPIKGTLGVDIDQTELRLNVGERKTIPLFQLHRFYNPTSHPIEFDVKIKPGSRNFEDFLQIMYGLAQDGKTYQNALPKNFWHICAVSQLGETLPPKDSFISRIGFIFKWLANVAERKGILNQLKEKYVKY